MGRVCRKAKKFGYYFCEGNNPHLESDDIQFYKNGTVRVYIYAINCYYDGYYTIAKDRTPDQMYQIIEALK